MRNEIYSLVSNTPNRTMFPERIIFLHFNVSVMTDLCVSYSYSRVLNAPICFNYTVISFVLDW